MTTSDPLRVGLVGTGYWAATAHAPGIRAAGGATLAGVWGRDPAAAATLAAAAGTRAYDDLDTMIDAVDALSFAVPPDVQAPLAARAATAGRHLLLEKPIALDDAAGSEVVTAVQESGVAAAVFVTGLFDPRIRALLDEAAATGGWRGGAALYLGSALTDDNPFNTPWRRVHGGLWDLGPHAVTLLRVVLGPVVEVTADRGADDLMHLVLHHDGGATSTATLTLSAPDAADGFACQLWGQAGRVTLPVDDIDSVAALTTAVEELAAMARTGRRDHRSSVTLGQEVLRVLSRAERTATVVP